MSLGLWVIASNLGAMGEDVVEEVPVGEEMEIYIGDSRDIVVTQRKMRERLAGYKLEHGHNFWVVERKPDGDHLAGQLLGFCGLKRANQSGSPIGDFEVGWRLREDAWGRGYAREAAEASLRAGFEDFGAPHIIALTVEGNAASWGLMRRLGMRRRLDLDFESTDFDPEGGTIIAYSITRDEWEERQ